MKRSPLIEWLSYIALLVVYVAFLVGLAFASGCDTYPECTELYPACAEICCTPYTGDCVVWADTETFACTGELQCAQAAVTAQVACEGL